MDGINRILNMDCRMRYPIIFGSLIRETVNTAATQQLCSLGVCTNSLADCEWNAPRSRLNFLHSVILNMCVYVCVYFIALYLL